MMMVMMMDALSSVVENLTRNTIHVYLKRLTSLFGFNSFIKKSDNCFNRAVLIESL